MSAKFVSGFLVYDQMSSDYAEHNCSSPYNSLFERPTTLSLLPPLSGKSILELGCGSGSLAKELSHRGGVVLAVDGSEKLLQIARKNFSEAAVFEQIDLENGLLEVASGAFDIAVSSLTLHYISNLSNLAREIFRVLAPGGLFVFSVHHPMMDFKLSKTEKYFNLEKIEDEWTVGQNRYLVSFYRRSLTEIFQSFLQHGFVLDEISEGVVSEELRLKFPSVAERLSSTPQFLFARFRKL